MVYPVCQESKRAGDDLRQSRKIKLNTRKVDRLRTVPTREEWFSTEHFSQHASNTPHINSQGVFFECQHHFWCTIPSKSRLWPLDTWSNRDHTYLVATYSVINVVDSSTSGGGLADRASPKSQSYITDVDMNEVNQNMQLKCTTPWDHNLSWPEDLTASNRDGEHLPNVTLSTPAESSSEIHQWIKPPHAHISNTKTHRTW